jgi:hypothetical protein
MKWYLNLELYETVFELGGAINFRASKIVIEASFSHLSV